MKKTSWLILGALAMAVVFGLWAARAVAQTPPPDDDMDMMLDMGMDLDGPPPGQGPGMGPGQGMEPGQGMRPGMMGPGGDMMQQRRKMALEKIKKEDQARYRRLIKIRDLAKEYRESDDDKRQKEIEKELRPLVDRELSAQQEENKKRIEDLEKKLMRMKKVLKQRENNWDRVVDYTVKEITGQNAYLRAWRGGGADGPRK